MAADSQRTAFNYHPGSGSTALRRYRIHLLRIPIQRLSQCLENVVIINVHYEEFAIAEKAKKIAQKYKSWS